MKVFPALIAISFHFALIFAVIAFTPFKIINAVIDNFDLFLYHRHSLREFVMLPDFIGQGLQFRIRHSLICFKFVRDFLVAAFCRYDNRNYASSACY
jgi:hypothetical protein